MTPRLPRTFAIGLAGIGLATALAGCSTATSTGSDSGDNSISSGSSDTSSANYKDGTYTADGSYHAPSGTESITVEAHPRRRQGHRRHRHRRTRPTRPPRATRREFVGGIAAEVVGKDIDTLNVSRVAGSSLTSGGFNDAIDGDQGRGAVES